MPGTRVIPGKPGGGGGRCKILFFHNSQKIIENNLCVVKDRNMWLTRNARENFHKNSFLCCQQSVESVTYSRHIFPLNSFSTIFIFLSIIAVLIWGFEPEIFGKFIFLMGFSRNFS